MLIRFSIAFTCQWGTRDTRAPAEGDTRAPAGELIVQYWTEVAKTQSGTAAGNAFAQTIVDIDKNVFSRTLQSLEGNTRILRGNLEAEIPDLKQQPGKKFSIAGVSLRSQLMALGLVDEIHIVIHPVIIGEGKS